jgi:hypothetical protein
MKAYKKQMAAVDVKQEQQQAQQKSNEPKEFTPAAEARVNFMQNLIKNSRVNA